MNPQLLSHDLNSIRIAHCINPQNMKKQKSSRNTHCNPFWLKMWTNIMWKKTVLEFSINIIFVIYLVYWIPHFSFIKLCLLFFMSVIAIVSKVFATVSTVFPQCLQFFLHGLYLVAQWLHFFPQWIHFWSVSAVLPQYLPILPQCLHVFIKRLLIYIYIYIEH